MPQPRPVAPVKRPAARPLAPRPVARQQVAPVRPPAPQTRPAAPVRPQPQVRPQPPAPDKPARPAKGSTWKTVVQFIIGVVIIILVAFSIVVLYVKYYAG